MEFMSRLTHLSTNIWRQVRWVYFIVNACRSHQFLQLACANNNLSIHFTFKVQKINVYPMKKQAVALIYAGAMIDDKPVNFHCFNISTLSHISNHIWFFNQIWKIPGLLECVFFHQNWILIMWVCGSWQQNEKLLTKNSYILFY